MRPVTGAECVSPFPGCDLEERASVELAFLEFMCQYHVPSAQHPQHVHRPGNAAAGGGFLGQVVLLLPASVCL